MQINHSNKLTPTAASSDLPARGSLIKPESSYFLPREGTDPTEWFLISGDLLRNNESALLNVDDLIEGVLNNGGRIAILMNASNQKDSVTNNLSAAKLANLTENFGADRVAAIYLEAPSEIYERKVWIRDSLGSFLPGSGENKTNFCYLEPYSLRERNWSKEWQYEEVIRRIRGAELAAVSLPIAGGDFTLLGSDTIVFTDDFKKRSIDFVTDSSPELQMEKLEQSLRLMGRSKIVFIPTPFTDLGHADCVVCQVGTTVFIPEIPEECSTLTPHQEALGKAREKLAQARHILELNGFSVEELPMGLPGIKDGPGFEKFPQIELKNCLMPCNLIQVLDETGGLHILVPWNVLSPTEGGTPNPSSHLYSGYQKEIEHKLKEAGAKSVDFVPFSTEHTGGLHCITKNIPGNILDALKSQLGSPDSPRELLNSMKLS